MWDLADYLTIFALWELLIWLIAIPLNMSKGVRGYLRLVLQLNVASFLASVLLIILLIGIDWLRRIFHNLFVD